MLFPRRGLFGPLATTACLVIANGLSGTAFALRVAEHAPVRDQQSLLLAAAHLGMLLGACLVPRLGAALPTRRMATIGIAIAALGALLVGICPAEYWFVSRLLQGAGAIWVFAACETWLGAKPGHIRPLGFALYMIVNQLGLALGQLGVTASGGLTGPMLVSSLIYGVGLLFLPRSRARARPQNSGNCRLPRMSAFVAAASGLFVGAILNCGPLFASARGGEQSASVFVACAVLAGLLLQIPSARATQRFGSSTVLMVVGLALMGIGVASSSSSTGSTFGLAVIALMMGATGFLLYPLAADATMAAVAPDARAAASGKLLLVYGAGAACSPYLVAWLGPVKVALPLAVFVAGLLCAVAVADNYFRNRSQS